MQKMRSVILHWLLAAITGAGIFTFCVMRAKAGEVSGSEAYFTHAHSGNCYETVTLSCEGSHRSNHKVEYGTYHCVNCNAQTTHYIVADNYTCPVKGVSWQQNAYIGCNNCGTRHSEWSSGAPGDHTYTEQRLTCGMQAGEAVAAIRITADDTWTNSGVTLYAKHDLLKQDSINGNISYDWNGGNLYVTENGTYSVTAKNGAGNTVTASIQVSCIDKIPPVINSVSGDTGGMTRDRIPVSVNAGDGESGLASEPFSVDGGATWTASASFSVEEGKDLSLAVRDKAGNVAGRTVKRSDFPYPPAPTPAPTPTPAPVPTREPIQVQPEQNTPEAVKPPTGQEQTDQMSPAGQEQTDRMPPAEKEQSEAVQPPKGHATVKPPVSSDKIPKSNDDSLKDTEKKKTQNNLPASGQAKINEQTENSNAQKMITISRMEKMVTAQTEGVKNAGGNEGIAGQKNQKKGRRIKSTSLDAEGGTVSEAAEKIRISYAAEKSQAAVWGQKLKAYIKKSGGFAAGLFLIAGSVVLLLRLVWLHSAVLYCYNGGDEFRKLGLLYLKKEKDAFELYLPDYLLETAGTPRYRLMVKSRLVKKWGKMDLVVRSEEHKLRQPLEECIDFVL